MKVVLLGYMGSGKSTIGKLLAERLDYSFIDLDEFIEEKEGKPIAQIFDEEGEIYFRRKESFYIQEVLTQNDNLVLSLGGGTPCYAKNMNGILHLTDKVFYLKVSVNELSKRLLKEKDQRPLIKNIEDGALSEFIGKHLFERNVYYNKARYTIDSDDKAPKTVVSEIVEILV